MSLPFKVNYVDDTVRYISVSVTGYEMADNDLVTCESEYGNRLYCFRT